MHKKSILIQARLSASRFPGKMLADLGGIPLLEFVYNRCLSSKKADMVAVITSDDKSDDPLYEYCGRENIPNYRGPLENVLQRYIKSAEHYKSDIICRVGGDTPFVDAELIDRSFDMLSEGRLDYAAPSRETCASGFYSETLTLAALEKIAGMAKSPEDLEHVTKFILENKDKFKVELIDAGLNPAFAKKVRFTVDYPEDIETARKIAAKLPGGYSFNSRDILKIIEAMSLCAA